MAKKGQSLIHVNYGSTVMGAIAFSEGSFPLIKDNLLNVFPQFLKTVVALNFATSN